MHSENKGWSLRWIMGQQSFHTNLLVDFNNLFYLPWLQGSTHFVKKKTVFGCSRLHWRACILQVALSRFLNQYRASCGSMNKKPNHSFVPQIFPNWRMNIHRLFNGAILFLIPSGSYSSAHTKEWLCSTLQLMKCLWLLQGRIMVLCSPSFLSLPWPMLSCAFAVVPRQHKFFLQGHQQDEEEKAWADFGEW